MPLFLVAECPKCKTKTLDVQVGKKSTCRQTHCRLCDTTFDYSAWLLRKTADGSTFHQIDLFERTRR